MRTLQENSARIKRLSLCCAVMALVVALDQITKHLAVTHLKGQEDYRLWEAVLHFRYHENRGAAFGMLQNNRWVFLIVSTVAILAIFGYLWCSKKPAPLLNIGLAMVAGGGIGNMIDRVANGYVVDFIYAICIDFAIFNVADSFVCIGAGLICLSLILDIIRESKEKNHAD